MDRQKLQPSTASLFFTVTSRELFREREHGNALISMAATFCNLNPGSGLKKLNEYIRMQSYMKRSYLGSKRSCCFGCSGERSFYRNERIFYRKYRKNQHRLLLLRSKAHISCTSGKEEIEEDAPKATLIWRAIKLPIYSVALVPLTVGGAAAYLQTGVFSAGRYLALLFSSILVITWLNLSNDVYDFDTGADKNKKESVVNLVNSRTGAFVAAYLCLVLGFVGLTWSAVEIGNIRSILLVACAVICGYIYQCPPFRLSYLGLGEPLCFAAFGPFATSAFYLLQGSTSVINNTPITGTVLSASILVGLTTTLILFCSHFHQVEGDMAVGKMSPLVRLGTKGGSGIVKRAVIMLYALLLVFGLSKVLPFTCIFLCALTSANGKVGS
ncbi:1,4-dihydroxy-2-naphthoate polyprenyltransferase, chloroplastic [Quillaja saponaria]|uniref:1,4-dihydroxy-2-naphthoate polyprenyltransferase, chloroplastic n=1 Tax=Quillaja saponaria TaxID=32244 RepID=A0AAD7KVT6_QUISA|nr:1,4-dihydroxy-2-naphthoate polyprenyltransferase, chloroplastic [Quillaja saponaria]